jgi:hypothetical protein
VDAELVYNKTLRYYTFRVTASQQASLRKGDRILAIDGRELDRRDNWVERMQSIESSFGINRVTFRIERDKVEKRAAHHTYELCIRRLDKEKGAERARELRRKLQSGGDFSISVGDGPNVRRFFKPAASADYYMPDVRYFTPYFEKAKTLAALRQEARDEEEREKKKAAEAQADEATARPCPARVKALCNTLLLCSPRRHSKACFDKCPSPPDLYQRLILSHIFLPRKSPRTAPARARAASTV